MVKKPAKFLFDLLDSTISFARTLLLLLENVVRLKYSMRNSKAYARLFPEPNNKNKNGSSTGNKESIGKNAVQRRR